MTAVSSNRPCNRTVNRIRTGCGSVGLGQFPVGQILLRGAAAHGGLDIVSARRNGVSAPNAARPSPGIEKFRIRFDDPVRVHRLGARGIRAIRNPLRRPKEWEIRQAVTILRETADDNRSGFGAGTQAEGDSGRCARPPPDVEIDASGDVDGQPVDGPAQGVSRGQGWRPVTSMQLGDDRAQVGSGPDIIDHRIGHGLPFGVSSRPTLTAKSFRTNREPSIYLTVASILRPGS